MELLFPLLFLGLMWFVLIRPQQQRVRRQQQLVASLEVGDEVVTAGGIVGRIVALNEDEAHIEVASGVVMRFLRLAVNTKLHQEGTPVDTPDANGIDGGTP
jgi:preprotein translocase subunit YajC